MALTRFLREWWALGDVERVGSATDPTSAFAGGGLAPHGKFANTRTVVDGAPVAVHRAPATIPAARFFTGVGQSGWEFAPAETHVLALGRSRSYKSAGIVIPALLQAQGVVVSTSVKSDVWQATSLVRAEKGPLWHFSLDAKTLPGCQQLRWSPIVPAIDWDDALAMARLMAETAEVAKGATESSYFRTRATDLIAPVLHAAALGDKPIGWVLECVSRDTRALEDANEILLDNDSEGARLALTKLKHIAGSDARTRDPIFSTAATAFSAYWGTGTQETSANPNFDPMAFVSDTEHPATLYITVPPDKTTLTAPLVVALIAQIRGAQFAYYEARAQAGLRETPPQMWFLDEVANIAHLPDLIATLSTAGGLGLQVMVGLQDMDQVHEKWPSHAKGFFTHFGHSVVFRGIKNPDTLSTISTILGKQMVRRQSMTQNRNGDGNDSYSVQTSEELFDVLDTGSISSGRKSIDDDTEDDRRILVLKPNGYGFAQAAPYYATSPFTEALVSAMEKAPVGTHAGIPNLDRFGNGLFLRELGGEELVERYRTARSRLQRRELTA